MSKGFDTTEDAVRWLLENGYATPATLKVPKSWLLRIYYRHITTAASSDYIIKKVIPITPVSGRHNPCEEYSQRR